jgi:hypothetical protein
MDYQPDSIYDSLDDGPLVAMEENPPAVSMDVIATWIVFLMVSIAASRLAIPFKSIGLPMITGYLFIGAYPRGVAVVLWLRFLFVLLVPCSVTPHGRVQVHRCCPGRHAFRSDCSHVYLSSI